MGHGLTQEVKKECLKEMRTSKNWVVWCRSRRKGNEELEKHLSEEGRKVFHGKCGEGGTKWKDEPEEKEEKKGRTMQSKGRWWRGVWRVRAMIGPGVVLSYTNQNLFIHLATINSTGTGGNLWGVCVCVVWQLWSMICHQATSL